MSQSRQSPWQIHLRIAEYLRAQIEKGMVRSGERLPGEIELAASQRVSRGTVRQAMQILVEEGLLIRIPGKGTFVRSPEDGESEKGVRSHLVGMVVPSLRDSLSTEMINGAELVLRQKGFSLVFCHSNHDVDIEKEQIQQLIDQKVRGILLFPIATGEEAGMIQALEKKQIPVVSIDRHIPGSATPTVLSDNFTGAYLATEHLLSLGHKRIACISNQTLASSVAERIRGYEQAMRGANLLPFAPIPLFGKSTLEADAAPPELSAGELKLVSHMLGVEGRPTAIFCVNDFIAIGVMKYLLAQGLSIPQDIAVVGFDDSPFAPFAPVPLTTIAQLGSKIGETAAQILFEILAGQAVAQNTVLIPTQLVVRNSSVQPISQ